MKIRILAIMVVSACLILTTVSKAQPTFVKGVKAGLNIATIGGDDISDVDSRTGFAAGLFGEIGIDKMFAIQPEVYYSMQGAKSKEDINGTTVDVTMKLDYIQIPVLFKFIIPVEGSTVKPNISPDRRWVSKLHRKSKPKQTGFFEEDIEDIKVRILTSCSAGVSILEPVK
ncbi:MAG: PorT family protein [Calditrichae bacterium]|nr:PorT family protein [Calditrichia bacterium]